MYSEGKEQGRGMGGGGGGGRLYIKWISQHGPHREMKLEQSLESVREKSVQRPFQMVEGIAGTRLGEESVPSTSADASSIQTSGLLLDPWFSF